MIKINYFHMRYLFISFFLVNTSFSYAQSQNSSNKNAQNQQSDIKTSRKVSAYILSGVGGALIGIPIGQETGGRMEANWLLAGAGAGLITSAFPVLFADDFNISTRAVRGDYKMERMKSILTNRLTASSELDLPYRVVDNYPASTGYELAFTGRMNRWVLGTKVTLRSTKGSFEYQNQDEIVDAEYLLRGWEITESVKYIVIKKEKIEAAIGLNVGMSETTENINMYVQLDQLDYNIIDKTKFLNIYLGPELSMNYYLNEAIYLNALIGYDQHIIKKHPYSYGGDIDREIDWSGIRFGLGVGLRVKRN